MPSLSSVPATGESVGSREELECEVQWQVIQNYQKDSQSGREAVGTKAKQAVGTGLHGV